jgi:tetratricopeptide (TPR) repeat protein
MVKKRMFDTEHLPIDKGLAPETAGQPAASQRQWLGRWATAACLLALLVLLSRLPALGDVAGKVQNPGLLAAAMPGGATGTAVATSAGAEVSGFQARALARLAQTAGQRGTVELWLRRGLDDPQSSYLAQFELCRLYWSGGRRDIARETCRDTKASAPYWLERGYAADRAGERGEALDYFQMAAAVDPALVAAWQQAGHALFGLARYDEAILAYERVLALAPTPPVDVFHSLSRAYLEMDNSTMARDVLNRGLGIYPNQREFFLVMAESYRQEADLATAESWYVRLLQRWPNDAPTWADRAKVAAADARWHDAVTFYQEAVALRPEDIGHWLGLAEAAVAADETILATHAWQQALALRPEDAGLWLRAGRFLADTSQLEAARHAFERVLALQPDHAEAAAQLAALDDAASQ